MKNRAPKFYNRKNEIDLIRNAINSDHCFIVITGRRRIGKTRLIREALKGSDHLEFFIPRKRMRLALDQLSDLLEEQTGFSPQFRDFRNFLEYIFRLEGKVIFIDEISNLDHINKGAFSDLQEMIDKKKNEGELHLIVDGSYVGIMKKIFEDRKEPLFGRSTNILELKPLPLVHSIKMLMDGDLSFSDSIETYSLFGGIPRYLELLRSYDDIDDIIENVFTPGSIFLTEGENVLIQEFGSSWDTHFSILEVISRGKSGPTRIAEQLGMEVQMLPKYLETLKGLKLIRRKRPIFGKPRHVRYQIDDPFFQFWFEICYPKIGLYRDGRAAVKKDMVRASIGSGMERVMVDLLFETSSFPFEPDQVGTWWNRSGNEVDILFYSRKERKLGVGEVKWRDRQVGVATVEMLLENIERIDWHNNRRREFPFIISKKGFTGGALDRMERSGISGFTLEDIERCILKDRPLNWKL